MPWVCVDPYQMLKLITVTSTGWAAAGASSGRTSAPSAATSASTRRRGDLGPVMGAEHSLRAGRYARRPERRTRECQMSANRPADLVFAGGAVYTVDAARRWGNAVAVVDGAIAAVGTDAEIRRLASSDT